MKNKLLTILHLILFYSKVSALEIILPNISAPTGCYPSGSFIYHQSQGLEITGLVQYSYYWISRWDNDDLTPFLSDLHLLYDPNTNYIIHSDFIKTTSYNTTDGYLYQYIGTSGTAYFNYEFSIANSQLVPGSYTNRPGIRIRPDGGLAIINHSTIYVVNNSAISGDLEICDGNASFSLIDSPIGSTITWQIIKSGGVVAQGTGVNAQASNLSYGDNQIKFIESYSCGLSSEEVVKNFWVGVPSAPTIYPETPIYQSINTVFNVSITNSPGANPSSGIWETTCCVTPDGTQSGQIATFYSCNDDGRGVIYVSTSNECGTYYKTALTVITGGDGECEEQSRVGFKSPDILIYPNPANEFIDITIPAAIGKINWKSKILIYDMFSRIREEIPISSYFARINISNLPKGTYYLIIKNKREKIFSKFLKQ